MSASISQLKTKGYVMTVFSAFVNLLSIVVFLFVSSVHADVSVLASQKINYQSIPEVYTTDAVIEAINQATISAQTAGRIQEIYFDVDDYVPKGSVIMRFRDTQQQAALRQSKAALNEAQIRFVEAKQEFKRIEDVYKKKLVSKAEFDKAIANHKAAVQRLDQAKAKTLRDQEEVDRTVVRAPYGGIVVKRHVQVGETARLGQALMTGFSMDSLRAITKVPQKIIALIKPENKAYVSIQDVSDGIVKKATASRVSINPYGNSRTHTYDVRLYFKSGIANAMPGMYVKASFVTGESKHLFVSKKAVVKRGEVTAVYVIGKDKRISYRQVRVGNELQDGFFEVLSGISEGEQVALDPAIAFEKLKKQN